MTRALVTGSTGFLGANLVAGLNQRGVEVIGLRRKSSPEDAVAGLKLSFVVGDILDARSLEAAMLGIDWVFHVAAVADYWRTPAATIYKVNVDGARNVFDAALKAGIKKVIYTSSSAAVGMPRPGKPLLDEMDRFNLKPAEFFYGHSKQLAEDLMLQYVARGLNAVSVLPSAVIGPRDLKFNVGELIVQALKPSLPFMPLPRGGLNYIDVRDCVAGHIAAAEKGKNAGRYLLTGHNLTHRQTMEQVNKALGTSVPVVELPRWVFVPVAEAVDILQKLGAKLPVDKGRVLHSREYVYYDNSKAVRELGLSIRPFPDSVRDAYEWYIENDYLSRRGISAPRASGRLSQPN
jgi:dihydroflavonol-4-reductase